MNYRLFFTKQALKDVKKIKQQKTFFENLKDLLRIIQINPFQTPPFYEKLTGDLAGAYSRRLNIQHRLVYQVLEKEKIIKIISAWSHYEQKQGRNFALPPSLK